MTMILSLGNRDQVIQIADRRLTAGGKVIDEESGKSGVLFLADGRFAFGFTGIARTLGLEMRKWLLKALSESAAPDYLVYNTLKRFEKHATDLFKTHSALKTIPPVDKRLTIMFSGYLHSHSLPMIVCAIISNYQNPAKGKNSPIALDRFHSSFTSEKSPRKNQVSWVQRVGAWQAMKGKHIDSLRNLLTQRKPKEAIIDKSNEFILEMSDSPMSANTIGKQLNWLIIPSDLSKGIESGYYSNFPTHEVFMPCAVVATGPDCHMNWDEPKIRAVEPELTPYMVVPKVKRKSPCPCGSGKRYKYCHGKRNQKSN